ncbi:MAG: ABC transporter, permease protein (cluster 3, basic aa/glutamine/opines) [uncultured Nocardioidaceae bacterium]|uniref:ABC transporter, permease protein (Cluster 3, basic aa/glutamine/opines) n=1 Tax=uncultured Nocardioidaceae bacterium TaxID=253824 RepID=A0A6J4L7K4_9ACTN|nr:MAG: ABC transporter, permease protein (cluster 3, basic aa/glutamine/opines) [uncultured Nocardioidaceae bacterium]
MAMSPRKRAQVSRGVQYAVLVVAVALAALVADWGTLREQFLRTDIIAAMFPEVLLTALKNTVLYTACGFTFGLVLGLLLALMRLSSVGPYRWLATGFIEFFRGLPALVVFISLSVGVPIAFPGREIPGGVLGIATLALGLVGGAYMAETIRAGIQAVPKGQMEAARSLGMPQTRAMRSIVIPQAFRIVLPPLTNELILLTKDSSLVYLLGYTLSSVELAAFGRETLNQENNFTPLIVISLSYLLITVPLAVVVRRMEARAERAR